MSECNYRPTGVLQGDTSPIADKGTGTGMAGDTYGASLEVDATNSSSMGGAAKSDGKEGI